MKRSFPVLVLILTIAVLTDCKCRIPTENRDDFSLYYDQYHVKGSFTMYDPQANKFIFYKLDQSNQPFIPASTFKICNSLIGLETGVIPDENFVIPWDSISRNNLWDQDQDLKSAFKNSTVWYYQELARRVGGEQMKHWIDTTFYGNADTSGGIDQFWLTGSLRITPMEQINFLQRLHDDRLPFSQRSMDIVKNIMIAKDTLDYIVRAKTGWGIQGNENIGWYVGYLEKQDKVYYFANCIQADTNAMRDVQLRSEFDLARREIVYKILDKLHLIP